MKRIIFTLLAIIIIATACEENEQAKTVKKEIAEAVTQTDTSVVEDSEGKEPVEGSSQTTNTDTSVVDDSEGKEPVEGSSQTTNTDTTVVEDSEGKEPMVVVTHGNKLNIKNFTRTDCKSKTKSAKKVVREYLKLSTEGKFLKIKHVNAEFNCCPGELVVTSKISNDTIFIDENETEHICNCVCDYDLNYEVGMLDYGKYHVVLTKMKAPFSYKEFDLNFTSNTREIINIKDKNY